jgi:serine phosphatase RsbU (regulator of sigma subunit)
MAHLGSHMRLRSKLLLLAGLVLLGAILALLLPLRYSMRMQVIEDMQRELQAIARTAALQLDGDLHRQVAQTRDPNDPAFIALRDALLAVRRANPELSERQIYTFYRAGEHVCFGVMTQETPFVGDPYELREGMLGVFERGESHVTDLYEDEYGRWVSAYAPIRDSEGQVTGLLEVDHLADEYFQRYWAVTRLVIAFGLIVLLAASLLGWFMLDRVVLQPVRQIEGGLLALARHDFQHKVDLQTRDEFQDLARTFNDISKQLDVARKIQTSFFPEQIPQLPGFCLAGDSQPCDATGGDYFDVFELPGGRLAIVIADVSGHGLGPSLLMASCHAALHALAATDLEPGHLVDRLDQLLEDDLADGRFITMVYGVLEPDGTFTYTNAGHGPALLVQGQTVTDLEVHRTPLGVRIPLDPDHMQTRVQLNPADCLFLASDGVTERMTADGDMFGDDRLRALLAESNGDGQALIKSVFAALRRFSAGHRPVDDITMVCAVRT